MQKLGAVLEPIEIVKRITVKRGKKTRTLVLVAPPWPDVGNELNIEGEAWTITKIKEERNAISVSFRKVHTPTTATEVSESSPVAATHREECCE